MSASQGYLANGREPSSPQATGEANIIRQELLHSPLSSQQSANVSRQIVAIEPNSCGSAAVEPREFQSTRRGRALSPPGKGQKGSAKTFTKAQAAPRMKVKPLGAMNVEDRKPGKTGFSRWWSNLRGKLSPVAFSWKKR